MAPLYQCKIWSVIPYCYFNACNASWVHAGTCIVINRLWFEFFYRSALCKGEVFIHRAMCVSCYDYVNIFVVVYGQFVELFVYLIAKARIDGCPCWVFYAVFLKAGPEVPHEKFAESCPSTAAFGIYLVAVPEEDTLSWFGGAVEYRGFVNLNAGEDLVEDVCVVFPLDIVISPDLDVAGLFRIRVVEFSDLVIDGGMGDIYLLKGFVFPEFFGIAKFYVGESLHEVIAEGAFVDEGVVGKVIGAGPVTAMHVGHDDKFGFMAHAKAQRRYII